MDPEMNQRLIQIFHALIKVMESLSEGFQRPSSEWVGEFERNRNVFRNDSAEFTQFLMAKRASMEEKEWLKPYFSILTCFDRMGYNLDGLLDRIQKMIYERIYFTDRGINEVNRVFRETLQLLENMPDLLLTGNQLLALQLQEKGKGIFRLAGEYAEEHENRLIEGICIPKASPIYLGLLESLKGIAFHTLEITEKAGSLSAKA